MNAPVINLYNGEVQMTFDARKHAYMANGQLVPGVTTILKRIDKSGPLMFYAAERASDYWCRYIEEHGQPVTDSMETSFICQFNTDDLLTPDERADPTIRQTKRYKDSQFAKARKEHKVQTQKAADIGTEVHRLAEMIIKGQKLPKIEGFGLDDIQKIMNGVSAFDKWLKEHKPQFVASERIIYSRSHHYAGTCDFVAKINGEFVVGDFKTGKGIYTEAYLQTAAYQLALEEEKDIKFDCRWIIRFDKTTGEFQAKRCQSISQDVNAFLACLELHRSLQAIEERES